MPKSFWHFSNTHTKVNKKNCRDRIKKEIEWTNQQSPYRKISKQTIEPKYYNKKLPCASREEKYRRNNLSHFIKSSSSNSINFYDFLLIIKGRLVTVKESFVTQ